MVSKGWEKVYHLTPKGHLFVEDLEKWCAEWHIRPEELPKYIEGLVSKTREMDYEMKSWNQRWAELVERGYLTETAKGE